MLWRFSCVVESLLCCGDLFVLWIVRCVVDSSLCCRDLVVIIFGYFNLSCLHC